MGALTKWRCRDKEWTVTWLDLRSTYQQYRSHTYHLPFQRRSGHHDITRLYVTRLRHPSLQVVTLHATVDDMKHPH
jgi:hypothetical protein